MKKILPINTAGKYIFMLMSMIIVLAPACKKDKTTNQGNVTAATSLRLVHSSYNNNATPADLYVDDVKLTTGGAVAFSNASSYYPLTNGSRKISAKTNTGAVLADTTLNIADGIQYSFFIKDRLWTNATNITTTLKTGLIAVADNNTTAPDAGTAKVRFVNMSSQPLNAPLGLLTFLQVNTVGSTAATTTLTQALGLKLFSSDYASLPASSVTFRVYGATSAAALLDPVNTVDLTASLEAGKLYTLYAVSTQYTVKTATKSPLALKLVANN
ncbi:DUF4397 domain-containing protein [Mucilaginibacter boryungensis]|uniref:DUF4397 domain-containing protein n=1 Tax=Mucilaginibacter boryungensis TaxID=768480 RepID=A0ABR9XK66_9SPHI|nr:DUF4397 domain-containing protein [Mucilaginibacter boryungensis]MBE9667605.1 DUF4397 domain-containing protein [Mucilaginibacter boryungensis]